MYNIKLDELSRTFNYMRNCKRCKRVFKSKAKFSKICVDCCKPSGKYGKVSV